MVKPPEERLRADERVCYRPAEAAAATGLSLETIKVLIRWGDLPVSRVGRCVLIRKEDLTGLIWATQHGWTRREVR